MGKQRKFNVEEEFAQAIKTIGGTRVTDLLGERPRHPNADFAFINESVVAELKCLEKDQISDENIITKASVLYAEELKAGNAPVVAFGEVQMTTAGFSDEYVRKIVDLYRVPIERIVKKAAKQIAVTAEVLNIVEPIGLLLLANDNHSALDPSHLVVLLEEILNKPNYADIEIAVIFSGNLAAAMPGSSLRVDYWIPMTRSNITPEINEFMGNLRKAWLSRLEYIFGTKIASAGPGNIQTFVQLESRRNTKLY